MHIGANIKYMNIDFVLDNERGAVANERGALEEMIEEVTERFGRGAAKHSCQL